jgi:phospholipid transport system substrate-binding protein
MLSEVNFLQNFTEVPAMRKTFLVFYIVLFGLAGIAAASLSWAQSQAQQIPAEKFIQDLGEKGMSTVKDTSLSPSQREDKYRDLLNGAFDMPTVSKFVLGRAWGTATPQQQQEFLKLFQALVAKTYGDRLNLYNGEGFKVIGFRPESDKDVIVNSVITHPQGAPPTTIDWRVRDNNGKLAVLDVVVEGISQSVTQRQEYASILERNNGNMDALLNVMRQKLQQNASAQPTQ